MKTRYLRSIVFLGLITFFPALLPAQKHEMEPVRPVNFKLAAEIGFLAPLQHIIRFGKTGSFFNYIKEGGQDNLFFFARLTAELILFRNHSIIFLYQPFNLETQSVANRDLLIDTTLFPKNTPLNLRYGFDFYRISYLYNFFGKYRGMELSLGASLQIRNAAIIFTSGDGLLRVDNRNIGPVPTLKLRGRYTFKNQVWLGFEFDGMYAPVKYLNGGKSDVEGLIIDTSFRFGYKIARWADFFLNIRYLGGGAAGTSSSYSGPGDGYNENWLHTLTVSLGGELSFIDLIKPKKQ